LALNVFQEFDLDAEDFSNMDKCFHKKKVPFKKESKKVVPSSCKDLLTLGDSLINGFILLVFILTKYIIT
jgi:hypothetical protein